jgi:hypothetical protein
MSEFLIGINFPSLRNESGGKMRVFFKGGVSCQERLGTRPAKNLCIRREYVERVRVTQNAGRRDRHIRRTLRPTDSEYSTALESEVQAVPVSQCLSLIIMFVALEDMISFFGIGVFYSAGLEPGAPNHNAGLEPGAPNHRIDGRLKCST